MDTFELGVDFGTSNTVAVLRRPDGSTTHLLFDASPLLPSGVFAGPDTDLLTGADADRAATAYPAGFEPNPKRRIDDTTVWLGERDLGVVDLVSAVLARVVHEAARVAGQPPAGVVLTHPAAWSRTRLATLQDAARRAGLGDVRLVAEPVAAAAYFASILELSLASGQCLVVYDLGAGTFDVSVIRRLAAGYEVIATDGLSNVGGLDLDAAVIDHVRGLTVTATHAWGRLDWPESAADQRARRTLWHDARAAKEQLSRHATANLHVPLVDAHLHLTREEFDKAARPCIDRTVALTLATLRSIGLPPEHIAGVFMVGGASRTPLAASLLHRTLHFAPTVIDQPELVVAEGSLHTHAETPPVRTETVSPSTATGPTPDTPRAQPAHPAAAAQHPTYAVAPPGHQPPALPGQPYAPDPAPSTWHDVRSADQANRAVISANPARSAAPLKRPRSIGATTVLLGFCSGISLAVAVILMVAYIVDEPSDPTLDILPWIALPVALHGAAAGLIAFRVRRGSRRARTYVYVLFGVTLVASCTGIAFPLAALPAIAAITVSRPSAAAWFASYRIANPQS